MILKDSGIFSPKIDSSQNLVFTIKVKKEDYTTAMQQFIFDCYNDGKQIDLEVVGLVEKNDEIPKLRQRLVLAMKEYSFKTKTLEETNKKILYIKYGINSRTELSRNQLEECIRFYQDGILYDN